MRVCQSKNNWQIKLVAILMIFLALGISFAAGKEVFAENGAEVLTGNVLNKWGGGGSGVNCNDRLFSTYAAECQGYSWVFYASTGNVSDMTFRPDMTANDWPQSSQGIYIPQTCSEHTEDGGGFWHFGQNARALSNSGWSYFGNFMYLNGYGGKATDTYTYSTSSGSYGHIFTTSYQYGSGNLTVPPSGVSQSLYKNGAEIYYASKVESGTNHSGDSGVWADWLKAYKYKNGSEYTGSDFPSDLYAFCYWGSMDSEYFARSSISNGIEWKSTNFVGTSDETPRKVTLTKRVVVIPEGSNEVKVEGGLRFSHNIYASFKDKENTAWNVVKEFPSDGVSATKTNQPAIYSGSTPLNVDFLESLYQAPANKQPFVDGNDTYISRDVYDLVFTKAGTYTFCEKLSINNKKTENANREMTAVCAVYEVKKNDTPPDGGGGGGVTPPPSTCGLWTPASYTASSKTSGNTSVVSKVRNATLGTSYEDSVYAKPTDNTQWIHCYYPGAQKVAFTDATMVHGAHDSSLSAGGTTANTNVALSSFAPWSNQFKVTSTNLRNPSPNGGSYSYGDSATKSLEDTSYNVEYGTGKNKAGKTLVETSTGKLAYANVTNEGKHSWACDYYESSSCSNCGSYSCNCSTDEDGNESCDTCCYSCTYSHSNCTHSNDYIAHSNGGTVTDHADVLVPFNFYNVTTITLKDGPVYSGETATISSSNVQTLTRTNNVTRGTYATHVENAKVVFAAYVSSSGSGSAKEGIGSGKSYDICGAVSGAEDCTEIDSRDGLALNSSGVLKLNSSEKTEAASSSLTSLMSSTYNAFDASAGKYYCVVAAVYPYTVSSDTDMNAAGSNSWYVSAPSCRVIAKKPAFQVWGNGLYTAGKVYTISAEKRITKGFYDLSRSTAKDGKNLTTFGSWVETSIIANGQVAGLASGAATGFSGDTARTWAQGLGGSKNSISSSSSGVCVLGPLTFPNIRCVTQGSLPGISASVVGGSGAKMAEPVDRDALIARFMTEDGTFKYRNTYTRLSQLVSELGSTIIPAGQNQTYVIDASGKTFTIDSNIQYAELYNNFTDIPKLIIRADNININCNVNRIDAVLIADKIQNNTVAGNVNTCSNAGGVDDSARSNQLKINGAVITGSLTANRTYGAGVGAYSVIPAEIVDYDSSLYIWGSQRAEASASGKLETVYIQELSPRL